MAKYRHIVFDVDGTLIDTRDCILYSLQEMLMTVKGERYEIEDLKFVLANTSVKNMHLLGVEEEKIPGAVEMWVANEEKNIDMIRIFDGIEELLEKLEKKGAGLNLTWEVRDGIRNHRTSGHPSTLEGKIVRLSDKIAYINHDIDDALRAGILKEADVPAEYREVLGDTIRERLNALIHDIVIHSQGKDDIVMSPEMEKAMRGMRNFLFENVYHNPLAKREEKKVRHLLQELYQYYIEHPLELSEEYLNLMDAGQEKERVVCDYIAGMTDQYAMQAFADLYIPKAWPVK